MRTLIFPLFILLLFIKTAEAQSLKKMGQEAFETVLSVVGKETIESSDNIVKRYFKDDVAEQILKAYDDETIERLAKQISDNPKLKQLLTTSDTSLKVWKMMGTTSAGKNVDMLKYFSSLMDDLGEQGFKDKYLFKESGDLLLLTNKNGTSIASIDGNIINAKPWKGGKNIADLNPLLNEHQMVPNAIYKINGQHYKTLDNGLYKEISGTLTHLPSNKPARNVEMQGLSKKVKDGVPQKSNGKIVTVKAGYPVYKDDGGHIIANMFGGGSEMYNYLPMSKKLNRQGGPWAIMEKKWEKALKEGKKVDYKINPVYESGTKRPDKLYVTYEIDGKRTTELFDNNVF